MKRGGYNDYYFSEQGDEYGEYEDYDQEPYPSRYSNDYRPEPAQKKGASPDFSFFGSVGFGPNRKLGFMLSGGGFLVTFLGIMLFFNSTLLRLGNLLFVSGLPLIIGPDRTIAYFTRRERWRATITFLVGMFLVLIAGWPVTGLSVEAFGFLNLFGNLFPLLRSLLGRLPVAGDLLGGRNKRRQDYDTRGYEDYYE
eukprot:CAMPEP_0172605142 /NCGR_PEP_ID=MMETSP1068-20121228/25378_1 /TAXON_ID=35684 /ORGANISM="Pseudopedinella elastica, Strain CCMP716" /LENGTH=195 /DNA_ID=CAMNT_0013407439 /DNA_START=156 /DNA_END=743 /DNA_ORIENTATION=-